MKNPKMRQKMQEWKLVVAIAVYQKNEYKRNAILALSK